jgi:alkaline phosphatase D
MASSFNRRAFLRGFIVTVAASPLAGCGDDAVTPDGPSTDPEDQERVFPQGLASGDPSPSSVILWVRVEPESETGPIDVQFEVATDEAFSSLVAEGDVTVSEDTDHTLRVKVTELSPFTTYYYRFTSRDVISPVGRTKTAPADDADVSVRFAFASCQDFIGRYYHSWKALAAEPDVDFVLYLGDYIYETNGDPDFQQSTSDRKIDIPDGVALLDDDPSVKGALTLRDYRGIYKQYRRDPDLRAIHARFPFICIWDDHEFANDAWQDHATDFNEAQGDEKSPERRHAASQAWFEFQPADVSFEAAADPPDDLKIYRTIRYGKHVELFLTDQRSYRDDHVIPEGAAPTDRPPGAPATVPTYAEAGKTPLFPNSEVFSRNFVIKQGFDGIEAYVQPTMLGAAQKQWLIDAMTSSTASWKIWGNQTQLVQMMIDLTSFDIPDAFKGGDRHAGLRRHPHHYDGQVSWDETLSPSASHGVTTCVIGNCGVGFAPVPRARPRAARRADGGRRGHPRLGARRGHPLGWESFPEYMTRIDPRCPARDRRAGAGAARRAAGVRDGRARRGPRASRPTTTSPDARARARGAATRARRASPPGAPTTTAR